MSIARAKAYYTDRNGPKKLNCAQAVIAAFREKFGLDENAVHLFESFGSGRAPEGECGALCAAKFILNESHRDKLEECRDMFVSKAGSAKCKEIRQLKRLPCIGCVETVAGFLDRVEHNKAGVKAVKKIFNVKQFIAGSCYSYILSSQGEALIIDAHISLGDEYREYLNKNTLQLKYIIDTHTHADHFSLAAILKKELKATVIMHEKAVSSVADRRVRHNDEIDLGNVRLKVLYAPGHTDDTINIYAEGRLFTGDVLLIGSVGRTDFQNGSPESMFDTLQMLKAFPAETIVFPGHDYHEVRSSVIAKEKETNPFLKESDKDVFINNMRSKVMPRPFNIDNIIRVNQKAQAVALEMISPKAAYDLISKDPTVKLLDVRSALEFNEMHIKDSVNIPIDMISAKLNEIGRPGQSYIVLCRTGNRSPMAADMLIQSGLSSVRVMDGGITKWQKDKLAVIKGAGGISLERQVRIGAGSLVLTGILLSVLVNPWFLAISLFVACGLIYAGLTDNCMMGMLLMKLPYNKKLYKAKVGGGTCSVS
ncbi:MAG: MBL fold metallo-hydrolase [Candidatus Omnitrophica bacterium]|nr:MBL fold metallo-hydrolase [Candidatus Omnitrophota bacterium]